MLTADYFSWIVPAVPDTSPVGGCSNKPSKHQSIPTVPVVPTLQHELERPMDNDSIPTVESWVGVEMLSIDSVGHQKWDPELVAKDYVWCLDCEHFNGLNCNHADNPFNTVAKQPLAPRKCQWYEAKLNQD